MEETGIVPVMAVSVSDEGRITRERYWRMVEDGVIAPDDRVELLEGVVVSMPPQNPPHAFVTTRLNRFLATSLSDDVSVRVQSPLDVSEFSTPEPDFAVVRGRAEDYAAAHPTTALLVIEVADTTVAQDRLTKARIYAAAGIPEYWIINLRDPGIEVYRTPVRAERRYAECQVARRGERLWPVALPGLSVGVAELLPPT